MRKLEAGELETEKSKNKRLIQANEYSIPNQLEQKKARLSMHFTMHVKQALPF